eukprot:gene11554-11697_t
MLSFSLLLFAAALPILKDDVVRLSPDSTSVVIDVLANDDLGGHLADTLPIIVVEEPASGSVTVLPADPAIGRARLLFTPHEPLAAGQEVDIYYSVDAPGQLNATPATAVVLGAAASSDVKLISCAPLSAQVVAMPIPGLSRADDAAATIDLPFPVPLHGSSYTAATVSSNGWVSFGNNTGAFELKNNVCNVDTQWPSAPCLGTGPVLAVFWDDLQPDTVLTYYDKARGALVIQWSNVMFPTSTVPMGTFQAHIFRNGSIGYVYKDLYGVDRSLGSSATIGIRGPITRQADLVQALQSPQLAQIGAA